MHQSGPLGQIQGDAIRNIKFSFRRRGSGDTFSGTGWRWNGSGSHFQHGATWDWHGGCGYDFDLSTAVYPTDVEIRPINASVNYYIRAIG